MKKKMYNDEELLRDKMLRHEFPANEQAWEQMEGMLNGSAAPPPGTPMPAPAAASTAFHNALIWISGIGLAGLLSLLTFGQMPQPSTEYQAPMPEHRGATAQPRTTGQSSTIAAPSAPREKAAATTQMSADEIPASRIFLEKNTKTPSFLKKSGTSASNTVSAPVLSAEQKQAPNPVAHSSASGDAAAATYDAASSPVRLPDSGAEASPTGEAAPPAQPGQSTTAAATRSPLSALPKNELLTLHVRRTLRMPKVAVSAPPTFRQRRFQVGAALGGQWAIVDRSINQVDLVPTFGVSFNGKIAQRWWAETGLMWRKVGGYNLSARWDASGIGANGLYGSWAARVGASEIVFLEMPLLAKYALRNGDQRLMAGVRLARLIPRSDDKSFTSVLNSYAPTKEFFPQIGDGFRRHDLALTIGVEARIFHNLWADIRHTQGLYDLTYDSFFGNTKIDRTADTQLTLRYYFWSF